MLSATSPSGLLGRVQAQLAEGQDDADVVRDLVAGGLSQASAERFVQRARALGPAPSLTVAAAPLDRSNAAPGSIPAATRPAGPPDHPAAAFSDRATLMVGAALLTLGLGLLWWAAEQASPVRMKPIFGLIAAGGFTFIHAARRLGDGRAPTPWRLIAATTAPVGFVVLGLLNAWAESFVPRVPAPDPRTTAAQQAQGQAIMDARQDQALANALGKLQSNRNIERCNGADALRLLGRSDAIAPLQAVFSAATDDYTKACTATALVTLGERDAMLPHYLEWIRRGSNDLKRAGISGIGQIGPAAAPDAIPVLQDTLMTSPYSDHRYAVVCTLLVLGPAARPALELAARDESDDVRRAARLALSRLPASP